MQFATNYIYQLNKFLTRTHTKYFHFITTEGYLEMRTVYFHFITTERYLEMRTVFVLKNPAFVNN